MLCECLQLPPWTGDGNRGCGSEVVRGDTSLQERENRPSQSTGCRRVRERKRRLLSTPSTLQKRARFTITTTHSSDQCARLLKSQRPAINAIIFQFSNIPSIGFVTGARQNGKCYAWTRSSKLFQNLAVRCCYIWCIALVFLHQVSVSYIVYPIPSYTRGLRFTNGIRSFSFILNSRYISRARRF